ncbi:hypothetical protein O0I10_004554 [Lichtheimia ornata]|uniref:DUSP domain-containing protein n=1 Tax=Lichtheimia ornata TaxID=688661 RepID=A0AAD7V5U8_9FUNG|nr:uncharacterized protein O0I10_004554 [Lichtheimia ornata]KAJ8659577.1 hypothetical protein O0I10_004554 [Lichtheimia ornata]
MNNIENHTSIVKLSPELILQVVLFLEPKAVVELGLTCHQFADFMFDKKTGIVFRRLVERDFGINYKLPSNDDEQGETWPSFYKDLYTHRDILSSYCCCHLSRLPDEPSETKRVLYRKFKEHSFPCDFCHHQTADYLNLSVESNVMACRSCLIERDDTFPVQLENSTSKLWCFQCKRELGGDGVNKNEVYRANGYMEKLDMEPSLDRRRKAEHMLYIQELRREDMSIRHFLLEKNWARAWMMFRTREGSSLPGKISNQKLARSNGSLNPGIRLPNDKYRPAPETSADIISEHLWSYLSKAYGVQGRAYSEDDMQYPEYARLRAYIDDFKKSILAYP